MTMSQFIKCLVMDVDGTLTDGQLYMGCNGELLKSFNIKDGYGIKNILPMYNIIPIIITGRQSEILAVRARELNITEIYQGISDKKYVLCNVMSRLNLSSDEVAYIGDDLNDLDCMNICGIRGCPADSHKEIKKAADYVCSLSGGKGCVREFIEYIIGIG